MDQPVATQDSLQGINKQWIFTKYDAQQRVAWTGIWNNGGTAISQASLQSTLNGISTNLWESPSATGNGYNNVAWPTTSVTTTLSVNYYDGSTMPGVPSAFTAPTGADLSTRGELTGTQINVLGGSNMLWTAHYYDYWGRSLESYAQHYLNGTLNSNNYDAITTTYDFTNAPTTVTRRHWTSASTSYPVVTVYNKYIYDWVGRKLKTWEQITNKNLAADTLRLVSNTLYNELGQLGIKNLHSKDSVNFAQVISYTYNERGWLKGASAPLFAMTLNYNTGANKAWNGNILYQYWGVPGTLNHSYTYTYDKLNRLVSGVSGDNYKENNIAYDPQGNITALNRYAAGTEVDQLAYTYTIGTTQSNQLQSVGNTGTSSANIGIGATSYTYDGNGNMLSANNSVNSGRNKSFTYNLLNLPLVVTIPTGTATYTYDASGNKLRKVSVTSGVTTTTDYIGGIEYDNSSTAIGFIQTEEGKAVPNGTVNYDYYYYLGDNLGNTRVTFHTDSGAASPTQKDDYYPFGLEISRGTVPNPKNEYLYNRKELQEEFTEYDYGARFYDPVLGRWTSVDPLSDKIAGVTPYAMDYNNPIKFVDPDGMVPESIFIEHRVTGRGRTDRYYTVNGAVAGFLSGALNISRETISNTTWTPGGYSGNGVHAMTIDRNVDFESNYASDNDIGAWVSLIGHESTHRRDYEEQGFAGFLVGYGTEYLQNAWGRGMSGDAAYANIETEKQGFANENTISQFFNNDQNKKDFMGILNNHNLSDATRANRLEALGIERIVLPGLEGVSSSLSNNLSKLSKDKSSSPTLINALENLQKAIKDTIDKDKKKIDELRH